LQRQSERYLLITGSSNLKQEPKRPTVTINPPDDDDDDDSDDMIGPMPAEEDKGEEVEEDEEEGDDDEFPTSHEIVLKDHSKVDSTGTPLMTGCFGYNSGSCRISTGFWVVRLRCKVLGFWRNDFGSTAIQNY
jgi:hypothetical protein